METGQSTHPTYSTLHFLVRHGDWVAAIVALVPLVGGVLKDLGGTLRSARAHRA